jgi:hypothetical protein
MNIRLTPPMENLLRACPPGRAPDLRQCEKFTIIIITRANTHGGKLKYGVLRQIADMLDRKYPTVAGFYRKVKGSELPIDELIQSARHKCGSPCKYDREELIALIKALPVTERQCIRDIAFRIGCGPKLVFVLCKSGALRRTVSSIRPHLKDRHKQARLQYSLSNAWWCPFASQWYFRNFHDVIFMDEKWFYITRVRNVYYLTPDEPLVERSCTHKSHIGKIMFLCLVSRPWLRGGDNDYRGLIGCIPVIHWKVAKNNSCNRPAGTRYPVHRKLTKASYLDLFIKKCLPRINKYTPPEMRACTIYIQHDNAKPHLGLDLNHPEIVAYCQQKGLKLAMLAQPAQSPDLNILDLSFFRTMQSNQLKLTSLDLCALIVNVKLAFLSYDPVLLNKAYLTMMDIMNEILKSDGDNKFKIPHHNKDWYIRNHCLPIFLSVFDGSDPNWKDSWQRIKEAKLQQMGQQIVQTSVPFPAVQANTAAGQPIFFEGNIDNNDDRDDSDFAVYDNEDLEDNHVDADDNEEDEVLINDDDQDGLPC